MKYYVNTNQQSNCDYEVHKEVGCPTPADSENRLYLGDFSNCREAVEKAKQTYPTANGCAHCSEECHTS